MQCSNHYESHVIIIIIRVTNIRHIHWKTRCVAERKKSIFFSREKISLGLLSREDHHQQHLCCREAHHPPLLWREGGRGREGGREREGGRREGGEGGGEGGRKGERKGGREGGGREVN